MKKSAVVTSVLSALLLALPGFVFAQEDAAPPPLTEVWIVVPKQGMGQEFVKAVEKDTEYRIKNGDTRSWQAFTVAIGKNLNAIAFRACCFDWADQDAYQAESEEKELGKYWGDNVHQYVDHYHRYFERNDWENSHWPEGEGDGPYYGVTTWTDKEGRGPESTNARKKMSQMLKAADWHTPFLWLFRIGGAANTMVVIPYDNYADMAPPETSLFEFMAGELGEEEAGQLLQDFTSGFTSSDYTVWKRHDGMSMPMDDE